MLPYGFPNELTIYARIGYLYIWVTEQYDKHIEPGWQMFGPQIVPIPKPEP